MSKALTILLPNNLICSCCNTTIPAEDSTLLMFPIKNKTVEFCSIKCMIKYLTKIASTKNVNILLQNRNLLQELKFYDRTSGNT